MSADDNIKLFFFEALRKGMGEQPVNFTEQDYEALVQVGYETSFFFPYFLSRYFLPALTILCHHLPCFRSLEDRPDRISFFIFFFIKY